MDVMPVAARYMRFWNRYAALDPETLEDRRVGRHGPNRWRSVPGTGIVVSRYTAVGEIGLFLRGGYGAGGRNAARGLLAPFAATLEPLLDAPFGRMGHYPFSKTRPTRHDDPADRDCAIAWLIAETRRYVEVAAAHLPLHF